MTQEYKFLNNINFPSDLRKLSENNLQEVSDEVRKEMISAVSETGGQTANQHFTTNQRPLETEDAPKPKNKKAKESVSMEGLGRKLNPHEGTGAEREDASGEAKPLKLD